MKWVIALTVTLLVASSGAALAQTTIATASLADVARAEEARRKTAKKATKMLDQREPDCRGRSRRHPRTPAGRHRRHGRYAGRERPGRRAGASRPRPARRRTRPTGPSASRRHGPSCRRSQMFAESMQTRLNVLAADIVNLDYPARGVAEQQTATRRSPSSSASRRKSIRRPRRSRRSKMKRGVPTCLRAGCGRRRDASGGSLHPSRRR